MLALLKEFRFVLRSVLKFSGFICTKADAQKDGRFVATTILDYLCLRDFGRLVLLIFQVKRQDFFSRNHKIFADSYRVSEDLDRF